MISAASPTALESNQRFTAWQRARGMKPAAWYDDDNYVESDPMSAGGYAYAPLWMGDADDVLDWGMSLKDGIACLNIDTAIDAEGSEFCGIWYHGYDSISAAIETAMDDPRVEALFIRMDTPGGVVHDGIYSLTEMMRERRGRAGGKPIHIHAENCLSAGYWIAAQGDRITASRAGMVGSIGAVVIHTDVSGALDKAGVKITPIHFGAHKVGFSSHAPLDDATLVHMQSIIDQVGRDFVAAVNCGRPSLSTESIIATEARCYCAKNDDPAHSGLALGLVDAIESEQQAFEALRASLSQPLTPAAGPTPTQPAAQSSARLTEKEPAMSAALKALTALSGDGKPEARIAAAIAALPKGSKAKAVLLAEGPALGRISHAKAILANEDAPYDKKPAVEDEDKKPAAEDDDDPELDDDGNPIEKKPAAEDDAEDAPKAADKDTDKDGDKDGDKMATAQAIMNLPEAKGRAALAQHLAFQPGATVKGAKATLALAAKDPRATVTDPKLSANGGDAPAPDSPDGIAAQILADAKTANVL
jgi:ClpP class serine protease